MSSNNSYAALSENQPENQSNPEPENNTSQKRELTNVKVTQDCPLKKLVFCELIKALILCYRERNTKTPYGDAFAKESENIDQLLKTLESIYSRYFSETAEMSLWERCFSIHNVKGDDLPVWSKDKDQQLVPMQTVIRVICGQLRLISKKQLIVSKRGMIGTEHYNLQSEIDDIINDILGSQEEIHTEDNRVILTEPLVDQFFNAHKIAKDCAYKAKEERIQKQIEKRAQSHAQVAESREKQYRKRENK